MITYVALPYQAYQLSGSSLVVGLLSLAELGPLLVTAFVGGALADAFDRRRLVQIAEASLALCAGILALNATLDSPSSGSLRRRRAHGRAGRPPAPAARRSTLALCAPSWSRRARSTPSAATSAWSRARRWVGS